MSNYSLVINSKFRPFEFDEMLKPVMIAEQAHREVENAYNELATQAATVEAMANKESDPVAYSQYKSYADSLRQNADDLATYGLNVSSRQSMMNLRRQYAENVLPIITAYNTRKEQVKAQEDALLKDPTHIFARRASQVSLDEYMKNPNLNLLEQNYSKALLAKQVSDEVSALAKAAREDPNVQTQLRHLLGFQYETIRRTGFSPEAIQEAILNSPNANPILTNIVDRVMSSSGISDWSFASDGDKARILKEARDAASQGLWSGVGQTQYGVISDDRAKAQFESNLAEQRAINAENRARNKAMQDSLGQPVVPQFERRNVRTTRDMEQIANNKEAWNKYEKYFYKKDNGVWAMTKEGRDLYKKGKELEDSFINTMGERSMLSNSSSSIDFPSANFYKFVNRVGMSGAAEGRVGAGQTNNLNRFLAKNISNDQYDATQATEYYSPVDASNFDNVISALGRASNNGEIPVYERVKSGNSYKFVQKTAWNNKPATQNLEALIKTGIADATTVYGQHGNYLEVTLKDGNKFDIPYSYISSQFNDMLTFNVNDALKLELAKQQGFTSVPNALGQEEDIDVAINRALNNAHNTSMSGLGTSVIKNQETQRGLYQFYIPQ